MGYNSNKTLNFQKVDKMQDYWFKLTNILVFKLPVIDHQSLNLIGFDR